MKKSYATGLLTLALTALIAGCGGGGGGETASSAAPAPSTPTPPTAPISATVAPDCINCGATSASEFTPGTTAGFWGFENTGTTPVTVPVDIGGVNSSTVNFILTNTTAQPVSLPVGANYASTSIAAPRLNTSGHAHDHGKSSPHPEGMMAFNAGGWKSLPGRNSQSVLRNIVGPQNVINYQIGDTRVWYNCVLGDPINCDLQANEKSITLMQTGATQTGRQVRAWVESGEMAPGRITPEFLTRMVNDYTRAGGIDSSVSSLLGPAWGTQSAPFALIPANAPIDIVFLNIAPDADPSGIQGYFFGGNNFTRADIPSSNESLALVLDTEAVYLTPRGEDAAVSTAAHEAAHMHNFYNRGVLRGEVFETWLEEMVAMGAEDALSTTIYPNYNQLRDSHIPLFLATESGNCPINEFNPIPSQCFSYAVGGSFIGYLMRQLGVEFLTSLAASNGTDSTVQLNTVISAARPGSSLQKEVHDWHRVMLPRVIRADLPAGQGFPARPANNQGIGLISVDLGNFMNLSPVPARAPLQLAPFGSHIWTRSNATGRIQQSIVVPPGTRLSVVIPNNLI